MGKAAIALIDTKGVLMPGSGDKRGTERKRGTQRQRNSYPNGEKMIQQNIDKFIKK